MSSIPNSAMPHAYVHGEEEETKGVEALALSTTALVFGGAALGYSLYRIIR